jgi:3-phosphoshikimate 1-carboxyvinyltransferase
MTQDGDRSQHTSDLSAHWQPPHPDAPLPSVLALPAPQQPASADATSFAIRPPGSKSLTNRALLLAALARGSTTLRHALVDADDARVMLRAITQLGATVASPAAESGPANAPTAAADTITILGTGGAFRPRGRLTLDLGNAGTATRFLAAACALLLRPGGEALLDGDPRMRERPIGELVAALRNMTCELQNWKPNISYTQAEGYPPLLITGVPPADGPVAIRFGRTMSSQFVSAALLLGPFIRGGVEVLFDDAITSEPYVDMTVRLLEHLGCRVSDERRSHSPSIATLRILVRTGDRTLRMADDPGGMSGFDLDIEPDASGATYFLAAAAMLPGCEGFIAGLRSDGSSLQGDAGFVRVIEACGGSWQQQPHGVLVRGAPRLQPFDLNFSGMPDTVMTAAVLAAFAHPTQDNPAARSTLRGVETLRVKETDRVAALVTELARLHVTVTVETAPGGHEIMRITPPAGGIPSGSDAPPVTFETYRDHRMAMSMALASLRRPNVMINDPACVAKTYPNFWQHFGAVVNRH